VNLEQQAQLRAPFPAEQIHTIPKKGIKLDYVGHADVTDRLLAVDSGVVVDDAPAFMTKNMPRIHVAHDPRGLMRLRVSE
jgi:hypothetical protein